MAGIPPRQSAGNSINHDRAGSSSHPVRGRLPHAFPNRQDLRRDDFSRSSSCSYKSADIRSSTTGQPKCYSCRNPERSRWHPLIKCKCGRRFHGGCHKPSIPAEPERCGWICHVCTRKGRKAVIDLTKDDPPTPFNKRKRNDGSVLDENRPQGAASTHLDHQKKRSDREARKDFIGPSNNPGKPLNNLPNSTLPSQAKEGKIETTGLRGQTNDRFSDSAYFSKNGSRAGSDVIANTVAGASYPSPRLPENKTSTYMSWSPHKSLGHDQKSRLMVGGIPPQTRSGGDDLIECTRQTSPRAQTLEERSSVSAVNGSVASISKPKLRPKEDMKPRESFEDMVEARMAEDPSKIYTRMQIFDGVQRQFRWYREAKNMQPENVMENIEKAIASPRFKKIILKRGPVFTYWGLRTHTAVSGEKEFSEVQNQKKTPTTSKEPKPISYCRFYDFAEPHNESKFRIVARQEASELWDALPSLESWDSVGKNPMKYSKGDFVELSIKPDWIEYGQIIQIRHVDPQVVSFEIQWVLSREYFQHGQHNISNLEEWPSPNIHLLSTWKGLCNQNSIKSKLSPTKLEQTVAQKKMLSFFEGWWNIKPTAWKIFSWSEDHKNLSPNSRLHSKRRRESDTSQTLGGALRCFLKPEEPATKKARTHEPVCDEAKNVKTPEPYKPDHISSSPLRASVKAPSPEPWRDTNGIINCSSLASSNDVYNNIVRSKDDIRSSGRSTHLDDPGRKDGQNEDQNEQENEDPEKASPAQNFNDRIDSRDESGAKLPHVAVEEPDPNNGYLTPSMKKAGAEPEVQAEKLPLDEPRNDAESGCHSKSQETPVAVQEAIDRAPTPSKDSEVTTEPPHIARVRRLYNIPPLRRFKVCVHDEELAYRDIENDEVWVVPRRPRDKPRVLRLDRWSKIRSSPSLRHAEFKDTGIASDQESRTKHIRAVGDMMRRRLLRNKDYVDLGELVAAALMREKEGLATSL